jgi:two-component system, NarL family, sensor histidine kinase DesK
MPSTEEELPEFGSPRVARLQLMILAALLALQINAILDMPMPPDRLAASLVAVIALAALQAWHFRGRARCSLWMRLGVLAAEILVTYLPLVALGVAWPGMGGFLVASVLIEVPGRAAWALLTAVLMSLFGVVMLLGLGARNTYNITVASLAVGLTIFGVCRLTFMIRRLDDMRTEVAQLAVIRERLRFARDLHDLLGYSLAAITLRAELARRLIKSGDSARASDELRDVIDVARQAVAEVRHVADGYRNISLAQEAAAAAALLASTKVSAHVHLNCGVLPDKIDRVLAMVLRELITNILRHSKARNCWIRTEQVGGHITLSVANDGAPRTAATHRDGGGLENLAWRLEAVGGTLRATVRGDGRFRVLVQIANNTDAAVGAGRPRPAGCKLPRARRRPDVFIEGSHECCESCSPRMSPWSAGRW